MVIPSALKVIRLKQGRRFCSLGHEVSIIVKCKEKFFPAIVAWKPYTIQNYNF